MFFATVCFCDGVFFAKVCVSATRCLLHKYMVVYFATGTGVVSFGGRVFFATLCFLRRSVGVFCVDQKCFLHSESVFLRHRGFFATESRVYSNIGLDSLRDCGG